MKHISKISITFFVEAALPLIMGQLYITKLSKVKAQKEQLSLK